MAKHKTNSRRNKRSKKKVSYSKLRDEAQELDLIATTPEGAVRDERVDPRLQDEQRFPGLDRLAIRGGLGWSVPDALKRKVIEKAGEMVTELVIDFVDMGDGNKVAVERPNRKAQIEGAKLLMDADEAQYKRDKPQEAGIAAGAPQMMDWSPMLAPAEVTVVDPVKEELMRVERMIATPQQPSENGHLNGDGK